MKRTLIILLVLFRVCGYSQDIELLNVELNTPSSSEIGEAIVTAGELIKYDGLKIKESFSVKSGFITYQHSKGANYPFVSIKKGYRIYYPKNNYKDGRYWGIGVNIDNPDIKVPVLVSMVGLVSKMKKYEINNKVEELELTELCEKCYRQEFIYNGKIGNVVKFSYREFLGNIARPSFYQELEYDISANNIIGFKGLRVEILNTSNTAIDYIVLESFKPLKY